jgi:hypothetical protein
MGGMFVGGNVKFRSGDQEQTSVYCSRAGQLYERGSQTLLTYLLTYLLTPCSRVLLEKLTGFAASQEIPRIYGTRKFQSPQTPPTS